MNIMPVQKIYICLIWLRTELKYDVKFVDSELFHKMYSLSLRDV